jgi:alpha-L-fucosidase
MKNALILCLVLFAVLSKTYSQEQEAPYIPSSDPLVAKNLEEWQDLKFGIFMHWGTYSQWGVVESWSICPEDEGWTQRTGQYSTDYFSYKKAYEDLQKTFNPRDFDPGKWAAAAKDAGFKYMILTFKHHDGFCMFDSKYTDYKITSLNTPFHTNPRANIGKETTKAFREQGFKIGTYFSKPDWHCESYWWPYFPPKDRNVNYDPKRYPERWQQYKDFTYNQIEEILSDYGKVDILWLDGGWVRPKQSIDPNIDLQKTIPYDQDVDMAKIASMGRKHQPGLIVVDRSVTGEFENYRTPEQQIPAVPLAYPWETCMTMASSWSYVPGDIYKPAGTIIHNLVDIVAKGGNYLLNVGPSPLGDYDPVAYSRMKEIGEWMKVNGDAIYATRPIAPYKENNICFTQNKDKRVNAIYLAADGETLLPALVKIKGIKPAEKATIKLLGTEINLKWRNENGETVILIPASLRKAPPCRYGWTFVISRVE